MRRYVSLATAGALMLGTVMTGATGVSAAPITAMPYGKATSAAADNSIVEEVGRRHFRRHHRHHHRHGRRGGNGLGVALGAAGLVLGLSALAARPSYADPYYARPAYGPVGYAPAPWSPAWFEYCSSRFRTFSPQTGYYKGFDGEFHFCR